MNSIAFCSFHKMRLQLCSFFLQVAFLKICIFDDFTCRFYKKLWLAFSRSCSFLQLYKQKLQSLVFQVWYNCIFYTQLVSFLILYRIKRLYQYKIQILYSWNIKRYVFLKSVLVHFLYGLFYDIFRLYHLIKYPYIPRVQYTVFFA